MFFHKAVRDLTFPANNRTARKPRRALPITNRELDAWQRGLSSVTKRRFAVALVNLGVIVLTIVLAFVVTR